MTLISKHFHIQFLIQDLLIHIKLFIKRIIIFHRPCKLHCFMHISTSFSSQLQIGLRGMRSKESIWASYLNFKDNCALLKRKSSSTHISICFPVRNLLNILVYLCLSKDAQSNLLHCFSQNRASVMYQERCPKNLHNARFCFYVK